MRRATTVVNAIPTSFDVKTLILLFPISTGMAFFRAVPMKWMVSLSSHNAPSFPMALSCMPRSFLLYSRRHWRNMQLQLLSSRSIGDILVPLSSFYAILRGSPVCSTILFEHRILCLYNEQRPFGHVRYFLLFTKQFNAVTIASVRLERSLWRGTIGSLLRRKSLRRDLGLCRLKQWSHEAALLDPKGRPRWV